MLTFSELITVNHLKATVILYLILINVKQVSQSSKKTECDLFLTLEEEAAWLLYGSRGHSKPHCGVGSHGLRPQFRLHLSVE